MPSKLSFEDKIKQGVLLLSTRDDFMSDIEALQKKYGFPVLPEGRDENGIPKHLMEIQEAMYEDIRTLRVKYKLSEAYQLALGVFVQESHVDANLHSDMWYLNPYFYPIEGKNCITLRLYAETTLDDIKKRWPKIREAQKLLGNSLSGRKNSRRNLARDLHISRLDKQGYSSKEIARQINKIYKSSKLGYQDVITILHRLKKKTGTISTKKH